MTRINRIGLTASFFGLVGCGSGTSAEDLDFTPAAQQPAGIVAPGTAGTATTDGSGQGVTGTDVTAPGVLGQGGATPGIVGDPNAAGDPNLVGMPGTGGAGVAAQGGAGALPVGMAGQGAVSMGGAANVPANPGNPPLADDSGVVLGHPDANTQYPQHDGFTLYLVEEFNDALNLDTDPVWTWGDGALYEGMTRMVEDNIAFENGSMVIRVTDEPQPGAYSFSAADNVAEKPLASGELRTIYNNFRYGRYEARMRAPSNGSNYIHTMFAYRTPAYLLWREIDVEIQASPSNTFITNVISAPAGNRLWSPNIEDSTTSYPYGGQGGPIPAGFDTQSDFHVYAFEWLPTEIRWYVDGNLVRVKVDGQGRNNLPVPKESTKIVMNLWVFTSSALGGGDPANNTYPIAGEYDWFRFYKWDGDMEYPCSPTPTCLPPADLELAKNNVSDPLPDIRPDVCTGEEGLRDAPCGQ